MDDIKKLQSFLITRFLQVVAAATIATTFMVWLVNRTVFAWIFRVLFGTDSIERIGAGQIISGAIVLLVQMILNILGKMLPIEASVVIRMASGGLTGSIANLLGIQTATDIISDLPGRWQIVLWLVLFACVVLILLPYAIAAIVYSHIVVREFSKMEESELKKNREYEKQRNLMLSDIAHDLRTPMTSISGYAKALDDDMIPEEKKHEIYKAIQTKSARMNDLIGLLFDYVRLDSEGYALNTEPLDICELVRENVASMYQDIEDAGMELDIDIPEIVVIRNIDRVQFTRVITNLINNVIKHNDTSTMIGAYVYADYMTLKIMICDDGALIDEETAEHIFEPFVTGDGSRNTKGGTGLGLSIVHKIINMHGGEIELIQGGEVPRIMSLYGVGNAPVFTKAFVITL